MSLQTKIYTYSWYMFAEKGFRFAVENALDNDRTINETLKGSGLCEDLSLLHIIVGRRLELPLFMVHVPGHVFVQGKAPGFEYSIETTAGPYNFAPEFVRYQNLGISYEEQQDGIYLKPLSDAETIAITLINRASPMGVIDMDEALKDLNRAIDLAPKLFSAYTIRAVHYEDRKDWENALKDWKIAAEINPHNTNMTYMIDRAWEKVKDKERWLNRLKRAEQAIELSPRVHQEYDSQAMALQQLGEYQDAISSYRQAIKYCKPEFIDASPYLHDSYYEETILRYEKDIADCLLDLKDHDAAIELLDKVVAKNDRVDWRYDRAMAYLARGRIHKTKGNQLQAQQDFEKALADFDEEMMTWDKHTAYIRRGEVYCELGQYDQAIEDLEKNEGTPRGMVSERCYALGLCYTKKQDLERRVAYE